MALQRFMKMEHCLSATRQCDWFLAAPSGALLYRVANISIAPHLMQI